MKKPRPQASGVRILVVDDHPMTRAGIVQLIASQPDLAVCAEVETAAAAMAALAKHKPDLVLVDISLPDKSGIELIKDMRAWQPGLSLLVISMHDESLYAERALKAGAIGYIMKVAGGEKLLEAVRCVLSGKVYVSEQVSGRILNRFARKPAARSVPSVELLSDREFEIFHLLGEGVSVGSIAKRLHLSPKTVQAHRGNIKQKLGIDTAFRLTSYAAHWVAGEAPGAGAGNSPHAG